MDLLLCEPLLLDRLQIDLSMRLSHLRPLLCRLVNLIRLEPQLTDRVLLVPHTPRRVHVAMYRRNEVVIVLVVEVDGASLRPGTCLDRPQHHQLPMDLRLFPLVQGQLHQTVPLPQLQHKHDLSTPRPDRQRSILAVHDKPSLRAC